MSEDRPNRSPVDERGTVKLLVWDLDDTLWDGTLLEGDDVTLRPEALDTLRELDRRGILHSIASKNDHEAAVERLEALGIADYFVYPQIHWGAKSESIAAIAEAVNLGKNAICFVDDQEYERDEVRFNHPEVMVLPASEVASLPGLPAFTPRFVTDESVLRRKMYQAEAERRRIESSFDGPTEDFLRSLGMRFTVAPAAEEDLQRAEELTVRTNQLNATGYTYSYEELARFRTSPDHLLLVASLTDRYGTYGKIGLTLVERGEEAWTLKLLLMSCRVMSRGVGSVLLSTLLEMARAADVRLLAEFRPTSRNRQMYVTYRFSGFKEIERTDDLVILEHPLEETPPVPSYVEVTADERLVPSGPRTVRTLPSTGT